MIKQMFHVFRNTPFASVYCQAKLIFSRLKGLSYLGVACVFSLGLVKLLKFILGFLWQLQFIQNSVRISGGFL